MIAIVAYLAVVGILVAGAARAAEELLRLVRLPVRWSWAAGLLMLLALAAWAPARSPDALTVARVVSGGSVGSRGEAHTAHDARGTVAAWRSHVAESPSRLLDALGTAPDGAERATGVVWGTLSLALAGLLAWSWLRFRRATLRLPEFTLHDTTVRLSHDTGPAVVGLAAPAIVVPRWLLAASPEEQRLAVAHEMEHLRARDHLLLMAACAVVVLLPWHPAAWWMLARLRLAVELDCDARVLARGAGRHRYGSALIDIAARGARLPLGVPALADATTHLERRLIAMTPTRLPFRRTRAAGVAAATLLTALAACEAKLPSSPEIEAMDAKAVQAHAATKVALGPDSTVDYAIDGRAATRAEAEAIAPARIASVEVVKGVAGRHSAIRIATRAADSAAVVVSGERVRMRSAAPFDTTHIEGPSKVSTRSFTGAVYIDGVKRDAAALSALAPSAIESVEVIKGSAATQRYTEPEAANGVIVVKLKK